MSKSTHRHVRTVLIIGAAVRGLHGATYTITDLGGGFSAEPIGINNFGQIVGETIGSSGQADIYTGNAFIWQPTTANGTAGTMAYPLGSSAVAAGVGINSSGQITGYSAPAVGGVYRTFLFTPTTPNSTTGSIATLPIVPPANGKFNLQGGINDSGEVTAETGTPTTAAAIFSPTVPNGSVGSATNLSRYFYVPGAVSNSGQVVGAYAEYGGTYQAARFEPNSPNGTTGNYVDIADPGQGGTAFIGPGGALGVNSFGDVAGGASTALGTTRHAIVWKSTGQVIDLDPQLGGDGGEAIGINDADQVVGQSPTSKAFVYAGGVVTDLNTLITDPTWTLQSASGINDKGQIIGNGHHNGSAAAFLLMPVVTTVPARQWISTASGDWNVASNWNGGVPNGADAEADFLGAITSNQTVYTNLPVTAGTIKFNNSNSYFVTGSSTLTLLTSTGTASITAQAGTQEINLPLYVASNAAFNASTGATLVFADPVTIVAGVHVNTAGSVLFESNITLQTGATLTLGGSNTPNAITLAQQSLITVANHGSGAVAVLRTNSLASSGGTLDVTNNDLIVHNGDIAAVTALVRSGYAGGNFNGVGITSSTAAGDSRHLTAVGVIPNTHGSTTVFNNGHSFDGITPAPSDVLVKYTYYGDANLDGKVDGSDYSLIDAGYVANRVLPASATGWYAGDFNYDGAVDGSDYALIDNAYNQQRAALSSAALIAAPTAAAAAVPEPSTIGLIAPSD